MKKNKLKILILALFFLLPFSPVLAKKDVEFTPNVSIPGSSQFQAGVSTTLGSSFSSLGGYIKDIYNYLILIILFHAVFSIFNRHVFCIIFQNHFKTFTFRQTANSGKQI